MNKLSAIIIDDDPTSIDYLSKLFRNYFNEEIDLLGTFQSGDEALKEVTNLMPEVIFLDIEMPEMDGFELKTLLPPALAQAKTVIISGQEAYALNAIKHSVFDFLPKPISIADLRNCINKLQKSVDTQKSEVSNTLEASNIIVINRQDKALFIETEKISRIEAHGVYSSIYYEDNVISSTKNLKYYENLLLNKSFVRIHRSCMVNITHIKEIVKNSGDGVLILKDGARINLSKAKKDELLRNLTLLKGDGGG